MRLSAGRFGQLKQQGLKTQAINMIALLSLGAKEAQLSGKVEHGQAELMCKMKVSLAKLFKLNVDRSDK